MGLVRASPLLISYRRVSIPIIPKRKMVKVESNSKHWNKEDQTRRQLLSHMEPWIYYSDEEYDVLRDANIEYGIPYQCVNAIKSLSELSSQIAKLLNDDNFSLDNLLEKIADVQIAITQILLSFCIDAQEVSEARIKQIHDRLEEINSLYTGAGFVTSKDDTNRGIA